MRWMLNSREIFEDALALKSVRGLTDIQRAALFFIVAKGSYGADGRSYGASAKNIERVTAYFAKISHRLQSVKIERRSFEVLISQYDCSGALFYVDPPYHGTEGYYDSPFKIAQHELLKELLSNIKGRFILSYNDDDYVRHLYKGFIIEELDRSSSLTARYPDKAKQFRELLIRNF